MTDNEVADRVDLLKRVGPEAGRLALSYFRDLGALTIERKANAQDVVSRADRDVETYLRAEILARFPGDGIIGEEHGANDGASGHVWVIDPIDGTSPFLCGLRDWCVSIAIRRGDETVAGAIVDPNTEELFLAIAGQGATLNGRPLRIDPELSLQNGLCGVGASHRTPPQLVSLFVDHLLSEGGMFFRNGSGALMLANVAAGRLAGYCEPHMHPWDCLAGLLLVREAGGWTLDYPQGGALLDGGVVAASGPGGAEHLKNLMRRAEFPDVD
jgi:myo-inositol-1(or 4)-monophosphatase